MAINFTNLQCKEVICISDGRRLGFISDVQVEVPEGRVCALLWCPVRPVFSALAEEMRTSSSPGAASSASGRISSWWIPSPTAAASPTAARA